MSCINIKDPIHGIIELNELEGKIIDCEDFQRLRRIKQLATAHLVYPGANHTRFEHSLGTLFLASKIADKLKIDKDKKLEIRLHALLHDLGHVAFSHDSEYILKKYLGTHEKIGKEKILKGEIGDRISENFNKNKIADFEHSEYAQIVSSDIGADRMDYLKRDAYYTGVAYGIIDDERLINKMYFDRGRIGVEEDALEASESLLIARFMMFSTVYFHHTVRIASAMLRRAIMIGIKQNFEIEKFLDKGDAEILFLLSKNKVAGGYLNALFKRTLYKQVYCIAQDKLNNKISLENMERKLSSVGKCDVIIDAIPNSFKLQGFNIRKSNGKKYEISKISELVRGLKIAEESRKKVFVLVPASSRKKLKKHEVVACIQKNN